MSPEFIAILSVGVTLAGLMFTMNLRQERRMDRLERRMDRLEETTNQRFARLEDDIKQRFDVMDARLRTVEQGQAHLSGEMATLREAILLQPARRE